MKVNIDQSWKNELSEEFEKPYGYENSLYNCDGENKGEDKELLPELSI